jgi:hypothetical protein
MAIILPTFEHTLCQMVGICSRITETASKRLPAEDIEMESRYRAAAGTAFARLIWEPAARHLHVDVALRASFGKHPPSAKTPIATLRETLAQFEGLSAKADPHATFLIPLSGLPVTGGLVFVGNNRIKLSAGQTEIELTGATLTFRRSDIRRIRWNLLTEGVRLRVDATQLNLVIAESYLTAALKGFDSAIATYILGKKDHVKSGS